MLSLSVDTARPVLERRALVERVREVVTSFESSHGSEGDAAGDSSADDDAWDAPRRVWARTAGLHVLLGLHGEDAFARLTPLGGTSYGLAFRAPGPKAAWEPLLLVDELEQVVEHALIAEGALPG